MDAPIRHSGRLLEEPPAIAVAPGPLLAWGRP
jgi:hypothetical protein